MHTNKNFILKLNITSNERARACTVGNARAAQEPVPSDLGGMARGAMGRGIDRWCGRRSESRGPTIDKRPYTDVRKMGGARPSMISGERFLY